MPPRLSARLADAELSTLLGHRPLLAFDFDGTLAPIVARPADARAPPIVASRLAQLVTRLPVAVISGRAVDDLLPRLGFEPSCVCGSHGAEDPQDADATRRRVHALDPVRLRLRQHADALAAQGVTIEDKGASIALHHRLAPCRERAEQAIHEALADARGAAAFDRFGGKRVVNVVAAGSPDKAAALHAMVQRCHAGAALFAGDDVNDEPAFRSAPAHWLTLRVGRDAAPTAARWRLDGTADLAGLLQRLLVLTQRQAGAL